MKDVYVKFQNQTGDVYLLVQVNTLCTWVLEYFSENDLELNYDSEHPQSEKDKVGTTTILKNNTNNWDLAFTNTTGEKQSYKATLKWLILDAVGTWHELSDKWTVENNLESEDSKTEKGRSIFSNT